MCGRLSICFFFSYYFLKHHGFVLFFFFFKQKTAYEMRISDWSSDVCSSDLSGQGNYNSRENPPCSYMPGIPHSAWCTWGIRSAMARMQPLTTTKIGRASCRERVCQYV